MEPPDFGAARLLRAATLAAEKHRDQRRKDADSSPYINHPLAVACVLACEAGIVDEDLLVAALLHDTVEDTNTTFDEIEQLFGTAVRQLVAEVTDDKSLAKGERKALQIEHARHASPRAKQLKIADKISNIRDITHRPPKSWAAPRKSEYLEWAEQVVSGCRGINPALDEAFDTAVREAKKGLGLTS